MGVLETFQKFSMIYENGGLDPDMFSGTEVLVFCYVALFYGLGIGIGFGLFCDWVLIFLRWFWRKCKALFARFEKKTE